MAGDAESDESFHALLRKLAAAHEREIRSLEVKLQGGTAPGAACPSGIARFSEETSRPCATNLTSIREVDVEGAGTVRPVTKTRSVPSSSAVRQIAADPEHSAHGSVTYTAISIPNGSKAHDVASANALRSGGPEGTGEHRDPTASLEVPHGSRARTSTAASSARYSSANNSCHLGRDSEDMETYGVSSKSLVLPQGLRFRPSDVSASSSGRKSSLWVDSSACGSRSFSSSRMGSQRDSDLQHTGEGSLWKVWYGILGKNAFVRKPTKLPAHWLSSDDLAHNVQAGFQTTEGGELRQNSGLCGRFMLRPTTGRSLTWDLIGLICIGWDMVWVPLMVFAFTGNPVLTGLQWFAMIFWTCDLPLRFFVGYNTEDGMIEMRPWMIMRRYICTWFSFDLALVLIDWIEVFSSVGGNTLGLFRTLKSTRICRALRLLRALKIIRVLKANDTLHDIIEHVNSVYILALGNMGGLVLNLLIANHFIACGWYGLATIQSPGVATWVDVEEEKGNGGPAFLYATSLHWSLTQFSSSVDVYPINLLERIYNIVILIFALIILTQILGSITSTMTELKNLNAENNRNKMRLRQFLAERKVSLALVARTWGCVRASARTGRRPIEEQSVDLLKKLPQGVVSEIRREIYEKGFMTHPFFLRYALHNPTGMGRVYNSAMHQMCAEVDDSLFDVGDDALKAYFLVSGSLVYQEALVDGQPFAKEVGTHSWISEVALWLKWQYKGHLRASQFSELMCLTASEWIKIIGEFAADDTMLLSYATAYKKHMDLMTSGDVWWDPEKLENIAFAAFTMFRRDENLLKEVNSDDSPQRLVSEDVKRQSEDATKRASQESVTEDLDVTLTDNAHDLDVWHAFAQRRRKAEEERFRRLLVPMWALPKSFRPSNNSTRSSAATERTSSFIVGPTWSGKSVLSTIKSSSFTPKLVKFNQVFPGSDARDSNVAGEPRDAEGHR